ncbi:ester cyclase [Halovivax sp.]|uniref:ester cyclase n=1 Tax=Halovivax sp. TaxID=1935978 RepID=UPI0025BA78A6|nr:ester cyclase [Halovivax sp.]
MTAERGPKSTANPAQLMLREVWSTGDLELIDELVADRHVHHDPLLDEPIAGASALKEWVATVRSGSPTLAKSVRETYVDGNAVILTYTSTGTHEGEIMGIAPTGRSFELEGTSVFRVDDGRLMETVDVWDTLGLFSQIGEFPEEV